MENKIQEERAMMESLGDCPECGHDLPGVAKLIGGRWQLFCTECRMCVIGSRNYAVKCWGLKEKVARDELRSVALFRWHAAQEDAGHVVTAKDRRVFADGFNAAPSNGS